MIITYFGKQFFKVQQGEMEIPGTYARTEALSQRYGETSMILIDPLEIQEDIGVEPEAGSTLAVNDELRRNQAVVVVARADARPDLYNAYQAEKLLLSTVAGADPSKLLKDPSQEPPKAPEIKGSLSINFKDLPAAWQMALGERLGMPPAPGLAQGDVVRQVKELSEAAVAADEMTKPAESEVGDPAMGASGKPRVRKNGAARS